MDDVSIKYASFVVSDDQYEFLRVSFGLCNSPSVFQRFVNEIFPDIVKRKIVLIYMDDLVALSENESDGLSSLKIILQTASQAGLTINWKKCNVLQHKVGFLGYVLECGIIWSSERKTEAVMYFPEPRNVRQTFLNLSGYFREFVPRYSLIARPLSSLLKTDVKFHSDTPEKYAFRQLKIVLSERSVLSLWRGN